MKNSIQDILIYLFKAKNLLTLLIAPISVVRRSLKTRIQLNEGDNEGGDEVIEVVTAEVIDKGCGHAVIDPIDDYKYVECSEQYNERDCDKRLECPK